MKPVKAIVAVTLAAAAFLACGKNPVEQNGDPQNGDAQLTLSADSIIVGMGDGSLLTATIRNASGPVQYVSRDQSVATVNAHGAI